MSIENSEKFVAVTTSYVTNARGPNSTRGSFVLAISGLPGKLYTVSDSKLDRTHAWKACWIHSTRGFSASGSDTTMTSNRTRDRKSVVQGKRVQHGAHRSPTQTTT